MPRGDGTGPLGLGPLGRGRGPCFGLSPNFGFSRRGFWLDEQSRRETLENQAKWLEQRAAEIRKAIQPQNDD